MEKQSPAYIAVITTTAISMPPKPPAARPKFQPKKSPEITAPTPMAQRCTTRAWRRRRRWSRYATPAGVYVGFTHSIVANGPNGPQNGLLFSNALLKTDDESA